MSQLQSLDILWILVCAALVFVMQAGFLCLESGLTRAKNAINVAVKNIADFAVASILFWLFGFGLMFGDTVGGLFGFGHFAMNGESGTSTWLMAFVLFQMMFCATAATIVSGAVAERMHFPAYILLSAVVAGLIYPVFGHWAWGGVIGGGEGGWLAQMGFVDFAGSTVVHSLGGWVALAAVIILGPREGRFVPGEAARVIPAGNLPVAMLGGLLLFFGWFGFNGGSTLAFNDAVPAILAHTALAAAAGVLAGILIGWRLHGYCEVMYALNGALAGLVAITACAHVVSGLDAIVLGAIGSVIMVVANEWLLARRIDDAVSAIPAHLAAGAWGTVAVALFGDLDVIGNGLSRVEQLSVQTLGVVTCGLWSFGVAWLLLRGLGRLRPLRVSPEDERVGLNVSEHGARTELVMLMETMDEHGRTGNLTNRVAVEPFTEVGQIASAYNRVIGALEEATEQTRAIIRDVRDGVITFTREGVLTSLNPGAEKLFGVAAAGVIGQPVQRLMAPEGGPQNRLERLFVPGEKLELRFGTPRERRVLEVSISENRVGQVAQLTGMVRDISERKQVEWQLHKERDLAQVTLASIGDGVITTDETGAIQYMNPVAERLTGWLAHEARGNPVSMIYRLVDEKSGAALENPVRTALNRGQAMPRLEHALLRRRDGENVPVLDTAAPIRSREGFLIGAVLVFHDVTVTLNLARELSHQASHDALTGVPNRREFERRLSELLGRPFEAEETHYLCYLDLDQFKVVNDTCGHVAGDELLRQVTALLRSHLRASDVLARLGGDEFGLILQGCPRIRALELAETFREAIAEFRFAWESKVFSIGVSIGVVELDSHERDLGVVLSSADAACYAAKEGGRNRVHLYQPDDDRLLEQHGQMQWVTRLQAALDQDRLRLYVQPIVPLNAPDRNCMHFEILVRLEENGKIVQPGAFLPAAERYNLMPRIDQWVVNNTLAWLGDRYRRHGRLDGVYCINLSGASLSDERFRQTLRTTLEQSGLPHGSICFEITETAAVANLSKVVHFIREVKQLGCAFSLDDFGCGLSSFAYLKTLPVDFLKIDGSFIKDIERDPIDMAMVQAINTIGHTMGLQTIAEFVESESVMNRLVELGLDYAQGYLLGEPRPLGEGDQVRMMPR
ncbi:MAG: ammonium transporter [Zoogloeaceae bacterium]|nr:ammonium transporter [Zoogloeaceae bacterium]